MNKREITYQPIGIVHSPHKEIQGTPIQPAGARGIAGEIEIYEKYQEGLKDLDGFSHILLIYHFHLSKGYSLKVKPFLDDKLRGVFATRAPKRPNSIGLSVVKLNSIEKNTLYIEDVDMLDGTPVLDIKPYVSQFDFTDEISCLERINSFSNLIVTQTLSKAYGLAGIRLGICYADKAVIEILNKIKMPYNVNVLTQKKAMESLREGSKLKAEISEIKKNKIFLIRELDQIKYVEKVYHSDVNFLLVKVDDANKRYAQLINHGIVVRNRTNEPLCENCLRFTVGTEDEMKKLITVLRSM